jgi:hypothetical protein
MVVCLTIAAIVNGRRLALMYDGPDMTDKTDKTGSSSPGCDAAMADHSDDRHFNSCYSSGGLKPFRKDQ